MATIFPTAPGRVVRLRTNKTAVPFAFAMNPDVGFGTQKCIVTQAAIEQQGIYQFLHTFDDFIYVYTFGDRISELQISGVAFLGTCDDKSPNSGSGIESILDYYQKNRIAVRNSNVRALFGRKAFTGFLTGSRVELSRPEMAMGQFFLRLHVIPAEK